MSSQPPSNPTSVPPPGWYFNPEAGRNQWWTGVQWLNEPPKSAQTFPLSTVIVLAAAALVLGFVAGFAVANTSPSRSAAPQPSGQTTAQADSNTPPATTLATASSEPQGQPITLTGEGEMNSAKTPLRGDYAVSWQTLGDCYYSADLRAEDTALRAKTVFTANKAGSGTGNVYDLDADDYFLKVITGPAPSCGWSVTLTPLT